jgi:peptidoglycan/LPS O-acetylase OafA/YrhL
MRQTAAAQLPLALAVSVPRKRLTEMDGLRGLAALSVFVFHALDPDQLHYHPLLVGWLADGAAAVDLFFVLSGLVLALPYVPANTDGALNYCGFAVKRVFRIYPAYLVAMALSLAAKYAYSDMVFQYQFVEKAPLHFSELVRFVLLIVQGIPIKKLNPVVWSLIVEMRVSLVFPLIIYGMRRLGSRGQFFAWAAAAGIGLFVPPIGYMSFFILGAAVAFNMEALKSLVRKSPAIVRIGCWLSALWLYHGVQMITHVRIQRDTIVSIAVAMLIVLISVTPAVQRCLSTGALRFLGDVSYSFYLVHAPILLVTLSLLPSGPGAFIAALLVSWVVAWVIFHIVEMPMHQFGRRLATRRFGSGNPNRSGRQLAARA